MSFTTNGNMHRHMRIHEKEMALGIGGGGQLAAHAASPERTSPKTKKQRRRDNNASAADSKELLAHLHSPPPAPPPPLPPMTLKRQLESVHESTCSPPKKAMTVVEASPIKESTGDESPYVKLLTKSASKVRLINTNLMI